MGSVVSFQFVAVIKYGDWCPWAWDAGNTWERGLTRWDQYGMSGGMCFV